MRKENLKEIGVLKFMNNTFTKDSHINLIKESIDESGYAIIKNLLNNEDINDLKQQIEQFSVQFKPKVKSKFHGSQTIRFGRLLWRIPRSVNLVQHPNVIQLLDELLLQYSPAYHLSFTSVMYLKEGQKAQVLHRDNTIFENTPETPINLIGTMWAIEDFKKENGATIIVPGSHRWYEDRIPKKEELVAAEMPAGSVLLYAGNLIHGSGACRQGSRLGVSIQYSLSWMTQEESQFLAIPPEYAAKHFDESLLKLIGYNTISRNCGEIDSEHLLDFILNDGKERGLSQPGTEYTNGKCRSLFFKSGRIRTADHHYNVELE